VALCTIDDLKEYLGETASKDDDLLTRLVNSASAAIETYCHRPFASATYTEYYDGTGKDILTLRHFPIISVTSVMEGGSNSLTSGEDPYAAAAPDVIIYKEEGQLCRNLLYWISYRRYYKVVYVAGYTTIPADIAQACIELAALMLKGKEHAGIQAKTTGVQTTTYIQELSEPSRRTMDLYRDFVLGRAA
jgi:Phage gp6-like head-tail connector protein